MLGRAILLLTIAGLRSLAPTEATAKPKSGERQQKPGSPAKPTSATPQQQSGSPTKPATQKALLLISLQRIKSQKRVPLPPGCPADKVVLRAFRADGGWTVGPRDCADSPAAALSIYESQCNAGSAIDCYHLGLAHAHDIGPKLVTRRDPKAAAAAFHKACETGFVTGCADESRFGPQDGRTTSQRASACYDGGAAAVCLELGVDEQKVQHTTALFVGTLEDPESYLDIEKTISEVPTPEFVRARDLYKRACDRGDANGCAGLASMIVAGQAPPLDLPLASELYARACDTGLPQACSGLGALYGVVGDYESDAALQTASCNAGAGRGCTSLAVLYRLGRGVPPDGERAADLYSRGCEHYDQLGCAELERFMPDPQLRLGPGDQEGYLDDWLRDADIVKLAEVLRAAKS
jgi:TPR repeat protein